MHTGDSEPLGIFSGILLRRYLSAGPVHKHSPVVLFGEEDFVQVAKNRDGWDVETERAARVQDLGMVLPSALGR